MPIPLTVSEFREIEAELSELRYGEIPIGLTLSDQLVIDFFWGNGDWPWRVKWLNRVRRARHRALPRRGAWADSSSLDGRVLVTWQTSTPRINDMLLPVVEELGDQRCAVIMAHESAIPGLSPHLPVVDGGRGPAYRVDAWRSRYEGAHPGWATLVSSLCRQHGLPPGAFEALSLALLASSQRIEKFLQLFQAHRPSAVLTEYDRNHVWSCLVLAARHLGIPTATLVHGVIPPTAVGFTPVLADRIICWGELDKAKLLSAGEAPEKIVVGGCPRLTRDLGTRAVAGEKLGVRPEAQVALLATSPDRGYLELAELFCRTLEHMPDFDGIVRLHPSENKAVYARVAGRYPAIRFMENQEASLDESLAAADVVVVRGSGVGSDALLKRRPVVVLDPGSGPAGHDEDLVELAGCPRVRSSEELSGTLRQLLCDPSFREDLYRPAEKYIANFCAAFGRESARLIVETVEELIEQPREPQ